MKRIKVLQVTAMYPSPQAPMRGAFVKSQLDSLRDLVDLELFVISGGSGILPYARKLVHLTRMLRRSEYDVVHAHYGHVGLLVKMFGERNKPTVTSYCGTDLQGGSSSKHDFWAKINRALVAQDTLSIVKNEQMAKLIYRSGRCCEVVANGVNTDVFRPMCKLTCRREFGLEHETRPIVLFAAKPSDKNKNFALLAEALERSGVRDKLRIITLEGGKYPHESIPLLMNAADTVALCSLKEGSPNVVKEAMACDTPILTTDCGDTARVLTGVTHSRVLPHDVTEWAKALRSLVEQGKCPSTNGRTTLSRKGLEVKAVARRIVKLYEQCLER